MSFFEPILSAWTADTAYSTLMGNSAALNTDQESKSMCDELVGNELIGDLHNLHRSEEERGEGQGDDGEERGQVCPERQPQEDFGDDLAPDLGGVVDGSDLHSIQQGVL